MNPNEQVKDIVATAATQLAIKYAKGQREHGGNFFAKPTTDNIREEVLDLLAYTHVLELHKAEILGELKDLQVNCVSMTEACMRIHNIIKLVEGL